MLRKKVKEQEKEINRIKKENAFIEEASIPKYLLENLKIALDRCIIEEILVKTNRNIF